MFEKETEKKTNQYMKEHTENYNCENTKLETDNYNAGLEQGYEEGFQDGVRFGYNKANEWNFTHRNKEHQVIDCPKGEENKLYLLFLNSRDSKEFEFGRKVPVICYWNEEWCRFERLEHTIGERCVNQNDINAWKEIIPPELKENK